MTLAGSEAARILIADDEAPARARLRDLLDDCRDRFPLVIVDEARNGREALEVVNREKIGVWGGYTARERRRLVRQRRRAG